MRHRQTFSCVAILLFCTTVVPASLETQVTGRWSSPRRDAGVVLDELWRAGSDPSNALAYPVEARFAAQGLIVYDHGTRSLVVFDAATGKRRFDTGRHGNGPGEFTGRPVLLSGTAAVPLAIEFATRRLNVLRGTRLETLSGAGGGRWSSGCAWGSHLLLYQSGLGAYDMFVATADKTNRIIDSLTNPLSGQASLPFIVRQAVLAQLADDECLFLPLYHSEFAVLRQGQTPKVGRHVEETPAPEASVTQLSGGGTSSKVKRGAVRGGVAATRWRDFVAILFQGQSRDRRRVLDLYERGSLKYAGSVRLPFVADRVHVSGDTLVVVGDQDDEPELATFLMRANKAGRDEGAIANGWR